MDRWCFHPDDAELVAMWVGPHREEVQKGARRGLGREQADEEDQDVPNYLRGKIRAVGQPRSASRDREGQEVRNEEEEKGDDEEEGQEEGGGWWAAAEEGWSVDPWGSEKNDPWEKYGKSTKEKEGQHWGSRKDPNLQSEAKVEEQGAEGGGQQGKQSWGNENLKEKRAGDWVCDDCGYYNYAANKVCRFAKKHEASEAKGYSPGWSSWQGSAKRSKQGYEGGGGGSSWEGAGTRWGATSRHEGSGVVLVEKLLDKQKMDYELMSWVMKASRGARGEHKGGQQGGSDDDTTDGGEPPWGSESDDSEDEEASERCRARYGLRGVRVGEASHPGPQLRLAEAFARVPQQESSAAEGGEQRGARGAGATQATGAGAVGQGDANDSDDDGGAPEERGRGGARHVEEGGQGEGGRSEGGQAQEDQEVEMAETSMAQGEQGMPGREVHAEEGGGDEAMGGSGPTMAEEGAQPSGDPEGETIGGSQDGGGSEA